MVGILIYISPNYSHQPKCPIIGFVWFNEQKLRTKQEAMLCKGVHCRVFLLGTSILLHLNLASNHDMKFKKRPRWQNAMRPLWFRNTKGIGVCTADAGCKSGMCCNGQCRCAPGFGGEHCNISLSCLQLNNCSGHGICMGGRLPENLII